jgi:hypothetical protein
VYDTLPFNNEEINYQCGEDVTPSKNISILEVDSRDDEGGEEGD